MPGAIPSKSIPAKTTTAPSLYGYAEQSLPPIIPALSFGLNTAQQVMPSYYPPLIPQTPAVANATSSIENNPIFNLFAEIPNYGYYPPPTPAPMPQPDPAFNLAIEQVMRNSAPPAGVGSPGIEPPELMPPVYAPPANPILPTVGNPFMPANAPLAAAMDFMPNAPQGGMPDPGDIIVQAPLAAPQGGTIGGGAPAPAAPLPGPPQEAPSAPSAPPVLGQIMGMGGGAPMPIPMAAPAPMFPPDQAQVALAESDRAGAQQRRLFETMEPEEQEAQLVGETYGLKEGSGPRNPQLLKSHLQRGAKAKVPQRVGVPPPPPMGGGLLGAQPQPGHSAGAGTPVGAGSGIPNEMIEPPAATPPQFPQIPSAPKLEQIMAPPKKFGQVMTPKEFAEQITIGHNQAVAGPDSYYLGNPGNPALGIPPSEGVLTEINNEMKRTKARLAGITSQLAELGVGGTGVYTRDGGTVSVQDTLTGIASNYVEQLIQNGSWKMWARANPAIRNANDFRAFAFPQAYNSVAQQATAQITALKDERKALIDNYKDLLGKRNDAESKYLEARKNNLAAFEAEMKLKMENQKNLTESEKQAWQTAWNMYKDVKDIQDKETDNQLARDTFNQTKVDNANKLELDRNKDEREAQDQKNKNEYQPYRLAESQAREGYYKTMGTNPKALTDIQNNLRRAQSMIRSADAKKRADGQRLWDANIQALDQYTQRVEGARVAGPPVPVNVGGSGGD